MKNYAKGKVFPIMNCYWRIKITLLYPLVSIRLENKVYPPLVKPLGSCLLLSQNMWTWLLMK